MTHIIMSKLNNCYMAKGLLRCNYITMRNIAEGIAITTLVTSYYFTITELQEVVVCGKH